MSIAIQDVPERNQYTATAGQTVFTVAFPFISNTDLKVYLRAPTAEPSNLAPQLLTLTTDYMVAGAGNENGGTITLNVAATAGDIVTILGDQPVDRTTVFDDLNSFTVSLNSGLNNLTIMTKQIETVQRNLTPKYRVDELINFEDNVRQLNLELPILNDGYVWLGRGNLGDIPDDIVAANLQELLDQLSITAITYLDPVQAGTTADLGATYANGASGVGATLTNAGAMVAFVTDTVATIVGDRILVKDQTVLAENGIYEVTVVGDGVTNWVLTRTTDFDQAAEINGGEFVIVEAGATLANTAWIQIKNVTTMGTDDIVWVQFGIGNFAPIDATFITQTPNANLSNEQPLSYLATGILKSTTGTGVVSIAVPGTDYYAPGITVVVADGGTGATSFTPYAVVAGGTAATNPLQSVTPIGTTGQVLTSNGAGVLPSWQDVTLPAGSWVELATATASASVTIDFDNVITSDYDVIEIYWRNVVVTTASDELRLRVGTGVGPTYQASNYIGPGTAADSVRLTASMANAPTTNGSTGRITIQNVNDAVNYKSMTFENIYQNSGLTTTFNSSGGTWEGAAAVTSIRFLGSSGNITQGEFVLLGIKN